MDMSKEEMEKAKEALLVLSSMLPDKGGAKTGKYDNTLG